MQYASYGSGLIVDLKFNSAFTARLVDAVDETFTCGIGTSNWLYWLYL